jgi:hypothetical protein
VEDVDPKPTEVLAILLVSFRLPNAPPSFWPGLDISGVVIVDQLIYPFLA